MARTAVIVLILGVCLPEVLLAGVVLKAGEIDSGKVRVGVFAEVVYGKGKRDPVSGKWEKLVTARGYIKAVDAEGLTLGGRFRKKRIAFARIQTLLLAKSSRDMAKLKKATGVELSFARIDDRNWRIHRKLGAGALVGAGAGLAGAGFVLLWDKANPQEGDLVGFAVAASAAIFGGIGYVIGVPIGVSRVDPHDRFIASLAGSLIGGGVGYHITRQEYKLWPSCLIFPLVGATAMSEVLRNPPEARRVSVGLAPGPDGSVSALATLRF